MVTAGGRRGGANARSRRHRRLPELFVAISMPRAESPIPVPVAVTEICAREIMSFATALCLDSTGPGHRTTPAAMEELRSPVFCRGKAGSRSGADPTMPADVFSTDDRGNGSAMSARLNRRATGETMVFEMFFALPPRMLARHDPGPGPDAA